MQEKKRGRERSEGRRKRRERRREREDEDEERAGTAHGDGLEPLLPRGVKKLQLDLLPVELNRAQLEVDTDRGGAIHVCVDGGGLGGGSGEGGKGGVQCVEVGGLLCVGGVWGRGPTERVVGEPEEERGLADTWRCGAEGGGAR